MPARLSDTGKLARKHGLTYACVRYRLANGIPLDRPVQHGDNAKAWDTRGRGLGAGRKPRKSRAKPAWVKALRRAKNPLARLAA